VPLKRGFTCSRLHGIAGWKAIFFKLGNVRRDTRRNVSGSQCGVKATCSLLGLDAV
jgi:hypothetical protein